MEWLNKTLHDSSAEWKICFLHHPLYSNGGFHGPDTDLRSRPEPIFEANGVRVVLSGHEHLSERIKPRNGIYYFVPGNSGELRRIICDPPPTPRRVSIPIAISC